MATAEKKGIGIPASYKEKAKEGCAVLFCVKIKNRSTLIDDIPLHMCLKIFDNLKEFDLKEMKEYVKEHDICSPNPKDLTFKPIIFTAEQSKLDYYMLKIDGLPPKYKAFYDKYKNVGNVYKNFITHVTIDKKLYDDLKENGVKSSDIEFGPLMLENGTGNTVHVFDKSKTLEKNIKHVAAPIGTMGALESSPTTKNASPPTEMSNAQQKQYDSTKMLNTIATAEKQNGKNNFYETASRPNHQGEYAIGSWGLTPQIIRDTIHMNPELKSKYEKGMTLRGDDMRRYTQDNPKLHELVAKKHLARLEHHFGQDLQKIAFAWNQGIAETYKANKSNTKIDDHPYVKKISEIYNKEK